MNRALALLIFLVVAVAASAAGQDARYRAPRTDWKQPDLQGMWNFNTAVPLQRPPSVAAKKVFTTQEFEARRKSMQTAFGLIGQIAPVEAIGLDWIDATVHVEDLRTSLISYPENGRLPARLDGVSQMPQAEDFIAALVDSSKGGTVTVPPALGALLAAFLGGRKDSYTDFMLSERCLFDAFVPMVPQIADNFVQIIQGPDHLALINDFSTRIVALDGKPHVREAIRSWPGSSRGRWEGETLVIETRNFAGRPWSFAGAGTGKDKVVTERLTRTAANRLEYAATVVDPKTFKDRIELSFPMALVNAEIHENGCHEGNYSMRNSLSAARLADAAAAKKTP
jgi:hypothetical protein